MIRKHLKNVRGNSVLMLPLAVLILTCLIVLSFMFGEAFYNKTVMRAAVREGAREYQVSLSKTRALERANLELGVGGVKNVTVKLSGDTMSAQKNVSFGIPALGWYPFNLKTEAQFRNEFDLFYYER